MRQLYNKELETLQNTIHTIISQSQLALDYTVQIVNNCQEELVESTLELITQIDGLNTQLEKDAYRIVALQQPVAGDLRFIFALLNTGVELKRISEHNLTIVKKARRNLPDLTSYQDLVLLVNQMSELVREMFAPLATILADANIEEASRVARMDSDVDSLFSTIYNEMTQRLAESDENVQAGIFIIDVATSLERVGDYLTNICEHVLYLETGSIVQLN